MTTTEPPVLRGRDLRLERAKAGLSRIDAGWLLPAEERDAIAELIAEHEAERVRVRLAVRRHRKARS